MKIRTFCWWIMSVGYVSYGWVDIVFSAVCFSEFITLDSDTMSVSWLTFWALKLQLGTMTTIILISATTTLHSLPLFHSFSVLLQFHPRTGHSATSHHRHQCSLLFHHHNTHNYSCHLRGLSRLPFLHHPSASILLPSCPTVTVILPFLNAIIFSYNVFLLSLCFCMNSHSDFTFLCLSHSLI